MRIIYIFICTLLLLICQGCNIEKGENFINLIVPKNLEDSTLIFIIPGSGCSGCITSVEEEAFIHANEKRYFFVFTRIGSKKLFKQRFRSILLAKNILIDSLNLFEYQEKDKEIYPVLYEKVGGAIHFKKYFEP